MTTSDIGPVLAEIAQDAGRLTLTFWRGEFDLAHKADASPVTAADHAAEALILRRLAEAFPDLPVVSEEDASQYGTPQSIGERFFLVDPIDGTKAFIRGEANFTVNIALIERGRPVEAAVVAPASDETWFTQGGHAWKRSGDEPATMVSVRPWRSGQALALVSHTLAPDRADALQAQYGFDRRAAMDSSIKFCRLAEGGADLYPRHGRTMEWDIAAGDAVLTAAGGSVSDLEGRPMLYGKATEGFQNGGFVARGGPAT